MQLQPISELQIRRNFSEVMERVQAAAKISGRSGSEIRIVGVTKYVAIEQARWLLDAGCIELGESRPQAIWERATAIPSAKWHLIGHLQRNKVKRTLPHLEMIHSLDSYRLAKQISDDAQSLGLVAHALLEVNVSGDPSKTGLSPANALSTLREFVDTLAPVGALRIIGLMGMSSLDGDADAAHREFESLRLLRERWSSDLGCPLHELSMGMSGDFEIGIAHGATLVRIGSTLFRAGEIAS